MLTHFVSQFSFQKILDGFGLRITKILNPKPTKMATTSSSISPTIQHEHGGIEASILDPTKVEDLLHDVLEPKQRFVLKTSGGLPGTDLTLT